MTPEYRICSFCVMDSSNPAIVFDANGQCNCCQDALHRMPYEWWPGPEGERRMQDLARRLRAAGRGKRYDVMLGLSGGIDSAYLAHLAVRELDLRVLAVHVDGGWNSEPAVHNIEALVRTLDLDLHTYVVEWQEMRELQLSFLKASVFNQDIPQDHAFFSTLYRTAGKFGIRHFLSGVNFATECVVPPSWGHPSMDGAHAKGIQAIFGTRPLPTFPFMGLGEYLWKTKLRRTLAIHRPLNFMNYQKDAARAILAHEYGWRDYGGKHSESRFTKFYQEIYLPRKLGFDKRRLHLSSLIVSGQLSRSEAVEMLREPLISARQVGRDIRFISKKLGISSEELEELIDRPEVAHRAYPNQLAMHRRLTRLKNFSREILTRSEGKE